MNLLKLISENAHSYLSKLGITACLLGLLSATSNAQNVKITEIGIDAKGRIQITVDGPAGEYLIESTEDLSSEGSWGSLCRVGADGTGLEVSEPINSDSPAKFYRVSIFPTADGFHITGEFAQELESTVSYADLQAAFGLTFTQVDAVIPPTSDLSWAARNARVYAATIAALSKIAQDIRDSFAPGAQPTTQEIIAALSTDLSDGILNGLDGASPVPIGTTGSNLPAYDATAFNLSVAQVQSDMPGLDNIIFTDAGGGTLSAAVPASWGTFYWDSADWQE